MQERQFAEEPIADVERIVSVSRMNPAPRVRLVVPVPPRGSVLGTVPPPGRRTDAGHAIESDLRAQVEVVPEPDQHPFADLHQPGLDQHGILVLRVDADSVVLREVQNRLSPRNEKRAWSVKMTWSTHRPYCWFSV